MLANLGIQIAPSNNISRVGYDFIASFIVDFSTMEHTVLSSRILTDTEAADCFTKVSFPDADFACRGRIS